MAAPCLPEGHPAPDRDQEERNRPGELAPVFPVHRGMILIRPCQSAQAPDHELVRGGWHRGEVGALAKALVRVGVARADRRPAAGAGGDEPCVDRIDNDLHDGRQGEVEGGGGSVSAGPASDAPRVQERRSGAARRHGESVRRVAKQGRPRPPAQRARRVADLTLPPQRRACTNPAWGTSPRNQQIFTAS